MPISRCRTPITHRFLSDTQSRWFALELNASQDASIYPSWTVQFEDGITRSAASPESVSDDMFMEASDAFTNNLNLDSLSDCAWNGSEC